MDARTRVAADADVYAPLQTRLAHHHTSSAAKVAPASSREPRALTQIHSLNGVAPFGEACRYRVDVALPRFGDCPAESVSTGLNGGLHGVVTPIELSGAYDVPGQAAGNVTAAHPPRQSKAGGRDAPSIARS